MLVRLPLHAFRALIPSYGGNLEPVFIEPVVATGGLDTRTFCPDTFSRSRYVPTAKHADTGEPGLPQEA